MPGKFLAVEGVAATHVAATHVAATHQGQTLHCVPQGVRVFTSWWFSNFISVFLQLSLNYYFSFSPFFLVCLFFVLFVAPKVFGQQIDPPAPWPHPPSKYVVIMSSWPNCRVSNYFGWHCNVILLLFFFLFFFFLGGKGGVASSDKKVRQPAVRMWHVQFAFIATDSRKFPLAIWSGKASLQLWILLIRPVACCHQSCNIYGAGSVL